MFKSKHEFTCPDVVYLQARKHTYNKWLFITYVASLAALWGYGTWLEKHDAEPLEQAFEAD